MFNLYGCFLSAEDPAVQQVKLNSTESWTLAQRWITHPLASWKRETGALAVREETEEMPFGSGPTRIWRRGNTKETEQIYTPRISEAKIVEYGFDPSYRTEWDKPKDPFYFYYLLNDLMMFNPVQMYAARFSIADLYQDPKSRPVFLAFHPNVVHERSDEEWGQALDWLEAEIEDCMYPERRNRLTLLEYVLRMRSGYDVSFNKHTLFHGLIAKLPSSAIDAMKKHVTLLDVLMEKQLSAEMRADEDD